MKEVLLTITLMTLTLGNRSFCQYDTSSVFRHQAYGSMGVVFQAPVGYTVKIGYGLEFSWFWTSIAVNHARFDYIDIKGIDFNGYQGVLNDASLELGYIRHFDKTFVQLGVGTFIGKGRAASVNNSTYTVSSCQTCDSASVNITTYDDSEFFGAKALLSGGYSLTPRIGLFSTFSWALYRFKWLGLDSHPDFRSNTGRFLSGSLGIRFLI